MISKFAHFQPQAIDFQDQCKCRVWRSVAYGNHIDIYILLFRAQDKVAQWVASADIESKRCLQEICVLFWPIYRKRSYYYYWIYRELTMIGWTNENAHQSLPFISNLSGGTVSMENSSVHHRNHTRTSSLVHLWGCLAVKSLYYSDYW